MQGQYIPHQNTITNREHPHVPPGETDERLAGPATVEWRLVSDGGDATLRYLFGIDDLVNTLEWRGCVCPHRFEALVDVLQGFWAQYLNSPQGASKIFKEKVDL